MLLTVSMVQGDLYANLITSSTAAAYQLDSSVKRHSISVVFIACWPFLDPNSACVPAEVRKNETPLVTLS